MTSRPIWFRLRITAVVVLVLLCNLSISANARATDMIRDTISIVVTPKIIDDFNNPLPSVSAFYDNYESTTKFTNKIVVLAVGSGDHIFQYPGPVNPPEQTSTVFADSDVGSWTVFGNTSLSLDSTDKFSGTASYRVTAGSPGGQVVKTGFPNVRLKDFPTVKWATP